MAVRKVDYLVLGGGASGLSAAFYLQKLLANRQKQAGGPDISKKRIAVLEASGQLGGWMHSSRTPEGAIYESGPRSMRPVGVIGRNALNLAASLGLSSEVLPVLQCHAAAQSRYLYTGGGLHCLPTGLAGLLTRHEPFDRPLAADLVREVLLSSSGREDESIHDFGLRRFGKTLTANLIDPLCRGVFAGKITELSVRSCFPQLYNFEQKWGSVILGGLLSPASCDPSVGESDLVQRAKKEKWSVWSLKGGIQQFSERLGEVITKQKAEIHLEAPCTKIELVPDSDNNRSKVVRVHTADTVWETEELICALPAANLATLLPAELSPLSLNLQKIPSVTVAVVNLEFDGSCLPVEGFGYLVPSHVNSDVLGVIFDSCSFPQHDRSGPRSTRLTCMMGGAWFNELFGDPDRVDLNQLASVALATLGKQIGLEAKPTYCRVSLNKNCIPNYPVNHHLNVDKMNAYIRERDLPLTLVGASYKGASVNDCIYNSRLAVQSLVPDGRLTE